MDGYTIGENEVRPELRPFDPKLSGDFNVEQRMIDDWANAGSGYVGEVIAMTPIAGVRAGIDMARRVALEHENRAAAARRIEQRLREELADAAQHGLDESNEDATTMSVEEANKRFAEAGRARTQIATTKGDTRLVAVNEMDPRARDY